MKTHTAATPDQLLANLRTLIAEAEETLGEKITEGVEDHLGGVRERLEDAREKAGQLCEAARQKITAGAKQADSTIRSHPYESLAVALGVGVLLGALLRRNR